MLISETVIEPYKKLINLLIKNDYEVYSCIGCNNVWEECITHTYNENCKQVFITHRFPL